MDQSFGLALKLLGSFSILDKNKKNEQRQGANVLSPVQDSFSSDDTPEGQRFRKGQ
jgi:hypothetical protein